MPDDLEQLYEFYRAAHSEGRSLEDAVKLVEEHPELLTKASDTFGSVINIVVSSRRDSRQKMSCIKRLVNLGANRLGLPEGLPTIYTAASYNEPELIEYFAKGVDFSALWGTDVCPMSTAIVGGHSKVAAALIDAGWHPGTDGRIMELAEFAREFHNQPAIAEMLSAMLSSESTQATGPEPASDRPSEYASFIREMEDSVGTQTESVRNIVMECTAVYAEMGIFSIGLGGQNEQGHPTELLLLCKPTWKTKKWFGALFFNIIDTVRTGVEYSDELGLLIKLKERKKKSDYSHAVVLKQGIVAGRDLRRVVPIHESEAEIVESQGIAALLRKFIEQETPEFTPRRRAAVA